MSGPRDGWIVVVEADEDGSFIRLPEGVWPDLDGADVILSEREGGGFTLRRAEKGQATD